MSVLMSAGKNAWRAKSAKPKKKKVPPAAPVLDSTPPLSNASTCVWYWELDGVPTTVMFNKDKNEVWCNGYVLDAIESFSHTDVGGVYDFAIYISETDTMHQGRIKRHPAANYRGLGYTLTVNGCPIMEHTHAPHTYRPGFDDIPSLLPAYSPWDLPPGYEAAMAHPLYDDDNYDDFAYGNGGYKKFN